MKKFITLLVALVLIGMSLTGCVPEDSENAKEAKAVARQQGQYAIAQPVHSYNWSLERHLLQQLYDIRNQEVTTYSVWRSDFGQIEGSCASIGYGLPYDTSLTNPLAATDEDAYGMRNNALASVEQAEPNGIFASKNTNATWVMCIGPGGTIEPIYTESKVTAYPYPVKVDWERNRVIKDGKSNVTMTVGN